MRQQILPPRSIDFLRRFFKKSKSLFFGMIAAFIFCVLFDYFPNDPSLNTATHLRPSHRLGYVGSYGADVFFQYLGRWAYLVPFLFLSYSVRVWREQSCSFFFRPLFFFMGLIFLSFGLAAFLGAYSGSLGFILYRFFYYQYTDISLLGLQFFSVCLGTFLITFGLSITISFKACRSFYQLMMERAEKGAYAVMGLFKFGPAMLPHLFKKIRFSKERLYPYREGQDKNDGEEKPEQLNLFTEDAPVFETSEDEKDVQSHHAIADFKRWLQDKDKKKPRPSLDLQRKKSKDTATLFNLPQGEAYDLPSVDLLDVPKKRHRIALEPEDLEASARQLESVLSDFGVRGEIVNIRPGPVVTMYELMLAAGIKSSRVVGLAEDIARSMSALSARIAVIPGKNVLGIELPNKHRQTVFMRELLETQAYQKNGGNLALILGEDIGGHPVIADLAKMPHLLVAGTTGSGKSVSVNTMILSLLFKLTPEQCKFIMIDPKMLELSVYNDIPHLLTPVVTDPKKAVVALKWAVKEMENRYRAMAKLGVRNIEGYNNRLREAKANGEALSRRVQTGFDSDSGKPIFETQPLDLNPLSFIVVVVDEMADLMLVAGKEIEAAVQRLAQMARAAGIHLIMATQRPSVDVITGTIKANFPTRISFQVTSKIDSRTILGEQGAEQLLGQGDMLYMAGGGRIQRVHGPFVKDEEVEKIVEFLKTQGEPSYIESVIEDEDEEDSNQGGEKEEGRDDLYRQAVDVVLREGKASTSFVQRHLQIGYNRAARIIDQMEKDGVISPANHAGKREILDRHYG